LLSLARLLLCCTIYISMRGELHAFVRPAASGVHIARQRWVCLTAEYVRGV
jgi:hypothetical protein